MSPGRGARPGHPAGGLGGHLRRRRAGRWPRSNFVTAHDGFTLADTTAYEHKHNEANGEGNRDGSDNNRSWNHGVEGRTDDPQIEAARRRSVRNLLATLLLATGVPMLVAGDEFGRTQRGNNNAYCLDDETAWVDWELEPWQRDLLTTSQYLLRVRREHPVLRQSRFFAGRPVHRDGTKDLAWFGPDGQEMDHARWHDHDQRVLQMYLHAVVRGRRGHHVDPSLLVILQGQPHPVQVRLPGPALGPHVRPAVGQRVRGAAGPPARPAPAQRPTAHRARRRRLQRAGLPSSAAHRPVVVASNKGGQALVTRPSSDGVTRPTPSGSTRTV